MSPLWRRCRSPVPITAAQGAASRSKVTQGVVYGAVTAQGYPVVIKVSKTGRKIVRATVGLDLKCQVPPDITTAGRREEHPRQRHRHVHAPSSP